MNSRHTFLACVAFWISGCVSYDGTYSPGCVAHAGSKIHLSDGQFVWEKFTDSVVVDDSGNVVNQFPGYPMQGSYRLEGQILHLEASSGKPLANMHLQQHNERNYLLTVEQFEAWEKTGTYAECALVHGGSSDKG